MEKQGIIKKGITLPEEGAESLEDHMTKRAADTIKKPLHSVGSQEEPAEASVAAEPPTARC